MTSQAFGIYLRQSIPTLLEAITTTIVTEVAGYTELDIDDLRSAFGSSIEAVAEALELGDHAALRSYAETLGEARAHTGLSLSDILGAFARLRTLVWDQLELFCAGRVELSRADLRAVEDVLYSFNVAFVGGFGITYAEIQAALSEQAVELERQRLTIRELGTPILPLYEGILAMPLVGAVDGARAAQVMEHLLVAISEQQADTVILDITGVPVVDTSVAHYLIQTARAARLVGAHVVLVGIGAEVAQTIVQLGVDLSDMHIAANLQGGISHALARSGHRIV